MSAEKMSVTRPISDEAIVDYGIGTRADQDAAAVRIEARQATSRAAWMARPLWKRAWLHLRYNRHWYDARWRIAHASRALRGIECER